MEELGGLLALLAVICILSGPVALVVSLVALKKLRELQRDVYDLAAPVRPQRLDALPTAGLERSKTEPTPVEQARRETITEVPARQMEATPSPHVVKAGASLEQRIGTRWVLIAGVITVMFAVGFFLKYAYEQRWIGPLGRVLIAGFSGLVALAVGELTRRRGYDIAAKGVTALGFAILYATVFAAHRWYGLIGSPTAFVLAIGATAGAMLYAVALDEIVIAMLSLIGGYLTPVVLATGQNLPMQLFSYVLILSAGAMACAYWRKWSPLNILVFVGTYLLYAGWFERFYRPAMPRAHPPEQLGVALFWLAVFFLIYLVLPLLHTLVRRVKSATQDMVLVLANAAVVFYYLWTLLSDDYRAALALCSIGMGVAHLALAGFVLLRCRDDSNLWTALLAVAMVFITLAVPLYFGAYAVAMLWAVEGLLLIVVGLRYGSIPAQLAGLIALALAVGDLLASLPMHSGLFRPVLNTAFGTWCFVAVVLVVCHVLYRRDRHLAPDLRAMAAQVLYAAGLLVLMIAIGLELWRNQGEAFFEKQMVLVFAVFLLLFAARPASPGGMLSLAMAAIIAAVGSIFVVVAYPHVHAEAFPIFANLVFFRAIMMVGALFAAGWLLQRGGQSQREEAGLSKLMALAGILLLGIVLTQEIWFHFRFQDGVGWRFRAQMYISILWAVYATVLMVVGFWRRVRPLRYLALGIFLLLLAKIFLMDTRELDTAYRIAGFLVTGLALVGVSYLYQYLKKTGFFDAMLADKDRHDTD
jgi:uncharacterized membrane protein